MRTIIVGGGKVGFYLAKALLSRGYSVTVIEQNKEQCHFCANHLDAEISCGDGTSGDTLGACGAKDADAVIAVMGQDENNLVCCQMAKKLFGVKKTIAKVNNPNNADALKQLGIDIVISATDNIIQLLEHEVDLSSIKELIPINDGEATLLEITLPPDYKLDGISLMELTLPSDCNIVCIKRGNKTIIPRGKTTLSSNDVMLVVALNNNVKELRKALKLKG
ncbi:MAG: potassium channel family protein [Oscillospiraceae bacterium]